MKINYNDISNEKKLIFIAGPCVIESEKLAFNVAEHLKKLADKYEISFIFKASFDKANRTSIKSFRGPGIVEGMRILSKIKKEYNLPIITDIHLPEQAELVAEVVDIIQIPAFLCRQTDLLVAAAKTQKIINVKKAQFLAAQDMINVVNKLKESGNENIMLCERGTSFGYNNLVVDMTGMLDMKQIGYPVIFDGTHSVQKPGGKGDSTGGNRNYVHYLCRAAISLGIAGLFIETHPDPDSALSDGPNMIKLSNIEKLIEESLYIDDYIKRGN